MKYTAFIIGLLCALSFAACEKEEPGIPDNPTGNDVNKWIEKTMRDNYLWYQKMPERQSLDFNASPEDFFAGLLSDEDGKNLSGQHFYFSTLQKVNLSRAIYNDLNSYGFDFATFGLRNGNELYKIAVIIYVIKGSPAEQAGLKRGDWIIGVNGEAGTITNYDMLRSGESVTLQLAKYDELANRFVLTRKAVIGASRVIEDTPFLKDTVYSYGSKQIGYLMYNHFVSGPNGFEDTSYDTYMQQLFAKFKSQGVNEFVLDLRYNGGGQVTCAQLLASLLAPKNALGSTLCELRYNDKNGKNNSSMPFLNTAEVMAGNLNLKQLFVLTGQATASASELIINSLIPYLGAENIHLIGEQTLGKTVGMNVYDASDTYGWILSPVCFRVVNKDLTADYENGFEPDVYVDEFGWSLVDFGDRNDPLLREAIAEITGQTRGVRATAQPLLLDVTYTPRNVYRNNLLFIQKIKE